MLSQAHRRTILQGLTPIIGEEEVAAMLDEFPLAASDAPVTAGRFDERSAEVDRRFEQVDRRFEEIDRRFEEVDRRFDRLEQRMDRMDERFDLLELHAVEVDKEFLRLRADVHQMGRQLAMWTSSAIVGGMAVTASIVVAFGG